MYYTSEKCLCLEKNCRDERKCQNSATIAELANGLYNSPNCFSKMTKFWAGVVYITFVLIFSYFEGSRSHNKIEKRVAK